MLSKPKRLSTKDIGMIVEKGKPLHNPFITLRYTPVEGNSRFSISVPKKVMKTAVSRNKARRQAYSVVHKLETRIQKGFCVFIILKPGSEKLSFGGLAEELEKIFVKSGIIK